jgi:type IV pilus assembly protein PilM
MFGKKKTAVGLDIGSSLIKFIEMEGIGKAPRVVNFGLAPLLPDAIVDGEIMDREVVVDGLTSLFEMRGVKSKEVATSISGRGVIVKKISMERMKESEAREQIRWEAEQHIPFDINDVNIDFEILDPNKGEGQMDVLLVAAKSEVVNARVSLLQEAGLMPVAMDVAAFAVQNAFEANVDVEPQEVIALIDVGAEVTNINFVSEKKSHFIRDISTAGNDCSQRIQKNLGLSREQALEVMRGEKPEGVDQEALSSIFASFSEDLSVGIERVLPYLPEGMERMNRIFISGGGATIPGLAPSLQERFGAPVEILNPFTKIQFDPSLFREEETATLSPLLTQAVGLALRGGE